MTEQSAAAEGERRGPPGPVHDDALRLIDLALAEDRGAGDWTSLWTVPARERAEAAIVAKAEGILSGAAAAFAVFSRIDPRVDCEALVDEGDVVRPGDRVLLMRGPARTLLTGERVALNLLQHLSGIATLTRAFVDAVAGTGVRILDTRKTMPGMRMLEKAAVVAGGGHNHRFGLFDMVMIKDNHIAIAGGIADAVGRVREQNERALPIEVEVRTPQELEAALDAGVDRILLDNMTPDELRSAVRRAREHRTVPVLEASGNVSLSTVRAIAETGVDEISIGELTHSARALDFSLRMHRH